MSVKPITPEEALKNCQESVPDYIITAINKVLSERFVSLKAQITVRSNELAQLIAAEEDIHQDDANSIVTNKWPVIANAYEKVGWSTEAEGTGTASVKYTFWKNK